MYIRYIYVCVCVCFRGTKTFQSRGGSVNSNKLLDINPLVTKKIPAVVIYIKKIMYFFLPFDSTSMKLLLFRDILHNMPVAGI